jgi:hypothetical protein
MNIQHNEIKQKLLTSMCCDGRTIFYKKCNLYYYSRTQSFTKLFGMLVIESKVFNPKFLQELNNIERTKKERNKIEVIDQCSKMGEQIMKENKDFFRAEKGPDITYKKCFYITQKSFDSFIIILISLLKLVKRCELKNWIQLPNKKGFWRELTNDGLPVYGEVYCINGKNMIKL